MSYEVYRGFNLGKMAAFFEDERGWPPVMPVYREQIKLVRVTPGAALECGDGRFDHLENRQGHGVRILGGVNAVMAMLTGGDRLGLERATELLLEHGVTPGTHSAEGPEGNCGFVELWKAGRLRSARHPYRLGEEIERGGFRIGEWLKNTMAGLGGEHYRLNGNHLEEGVRINPFLRYTELATDGLRFRIDDWFMESLGFPDEERWSKIAETIEKVKPDAAKLEIIVP